MSLRGGWGALLLAGVVLAGPDLPPGVTVQDYNRAGRGILAQLKPLEAAILRGSAAPIDSGAQGDVRGWRWSLRPVSVPEVELSEGTAGEVLGRGRAGIAAFWRGPSGRFARRTEAHVKIEALELLGRTRARARMRYEVEGTDRRGKHLSERGWISAGWVMVGQGKTARSLLTDLRPLRAERVRGPGTLFQERARARGLHLVGKPDPRFAPPSKALRYQVIRHAIGGASTGDADGDGWDDVLLTTGEELALFLNQGDGSFRNATQDCGLGGIRHANATVFADFDNDGDQDLYVARFYGRNLLFRNEGQGRFRDVTRDSGLARDDMTAVLAVADFDNDGKLDLYLGRFLDARREVPDMILYTRNGAPNKLYKGVGGLRFVDVSKGSGADDVGLTLGIGVADYDEDGDQDIYLTNDYGRNVLLRNRGNGTFEDATLATNTLAISGGMSSSWGDYDNDGRLDIYVSSIRSNQRWFSQDLNIRSYVLNIVQSKRRARLQALFLDVRKHLGAAWDQVGDISLGGNYLLRQKPDRTFENVADAAGVRPQGWYWSSGFFDVDNDGRLDILAVDGWISGKDKTDL